MELARVHDIEERLRAQLGRVVMGHQEAVDLMLVALLCQGHVLLHGVPGVAKTLLARTFAASLSLDFQRIQFTPDLMPGDVLGTNLFNFETNSFVLTKGPVFTEILLADEINRTPPKTQAALLQAMQERSITLEGETHALGPCFMVIATQNPIEQEGTYPLPEAQLDRFLFKIPVGYPSRDEERQMVALHGHGTAMPNLSSFSLEPIAGRETLAEMRRAIQGVKLSPEILDYIVDLVRATREQASLLCGASPRAANMLAAAARARAALEGRDFVIPDDVKYLSPFALAHRVLLAPGAEIDGLDAGSVVRQVIDQVAAPR